MILTGSPTSPSVFGHSEDIFKALYIILVFRKYRRYFLLNSRKERPASAPAKEKKKPAAFSYELLYYLFLILYFLQFVMLFRFSTLVVVKALFIALPLLYTPFLTLYNFLVLSM